MAGPRILSLFSGYGGLELACRIVWPTARCVGYVERDAYAAAILMARMEDQALEPAPVWCGDIQDLGGGQLRGEVDLITAGFPCQDISCAGGRAGIEGERSGLWREVARLVRRVGPRYVFLENVSAIVVRGLDRVLGDLAQLGFDVAWTSLRASEVGAPHHRYRWFALAYSNCFGEQAGRRLPWSQCDAQALANPIGVQLRYQPRRICGQDRTGPAESPEPGPWPPGPDQLEEWRRVPAHLHPATEPGLRLLADGAPVVVDAARADQLRAIGNGVVPLQAACALAHLLRTVDASYRK
jgi:DNA (cytosine-5)-methyltransferase 1